MHIIVKKTEPESPSTICSMRLVSKAWDHAVSSNCTALKLFKVRKPQTLLKISEKMPHLRQLEILEVRVENNRLVLNALSRMTALTELSIVGTSSPGSCKETYADLAGLPISLRKLQLDSLEIPRTTYKKVKLSELQELSVTFGPHTKPDTWSLVKRLNSLRVSFHSSIM